MIIIIIEIKIDLIDAYVDDYKYFKINISFFLNIFIVENNVEIKCICS